MKTQEITSLETFLGSQSASEHHLEHYNHLVLYELPELIQNLVTLINPPKQENLTIEISFKNVHAGNASYLENGARVLLYPEECRKKDLYYSAPLYASAIQKKTVNGQETVTVINKVHLCDIPVMVGSVLCNLKTAPKSERYKECPQDIGGYFIVNGIERVLVTQVIKTAYNMTQVCLKKDTYYAQMRSMSDDTGHSTLIQCSVSMNKPIADTARVHLPYLSKSIPIAIFLKAMEVTDPEQIYKNIGVEDLDLYNELHIAFDMVQTMNQEDALYYIGQYATKSNANKEEDIVVDEKSSVHPEEDEAIDEEEFDYDDNDDKESTAESELEATELKGRQKQIAYAKQILDTEIFPHLGVCATPSMILNVIYYMLKHLFLTRAGVLLPSERDNLMFKRYENSGALLLGLFRISFKHYLSGLLKKNYSGQLSDQITKLCESVTKNVKTNLSTGKWGIQKNAYVRQGVSQVLSRLSYIGTLSHMQRIATPMGKEGKNTKIRLIHPSQFGYICLFETPEGKTCGIVNNMTITARITRGISTNHIQDILARHFDITAASVGDVDLWINHTRKFKVAQSAMSFVRRFKELRIQGFISKYVNIYYDDITNIIHILSDAGRITRPLYDRCGNIVWLDPVESQSVQIAMYQHESPTFDYCEIHPCLIYGIAAGCIPYSDHNQSPRNVYEASMIKQALGIFCYNLRYRYDSTYEVMHGVQRTLMSTAIARAVHCQDLPAGINCVVAIASWGSWNTEDSLIFKKEAVERGMFTSITYKTITIHEYKEKGTTVKLFCLPAEHIQKKQYNYSLLDSNGIVKVGSYVKKKDVIVGRVYHSSDGEKDFSELSPETGYVERVDVFQRINGYKMCKIVLKIIKIPERGDKFANMCAQKGTIGMILPQEDMPFNESGMVPDVVINPNALPSRMTISMFLEMVMGKYACLSGQLMDVTPFSQNSTGIMDQLAGLLTQYGQWVRDHV